MSNPMRPRLTFTPREDVYIDREKGAVGAEAPQRRSPEGQRSPTKRQQLRCHIAGFDSPHSNGLWESLQINGSDQIELEAFSER